MCPAKKRPRIDLGIERGHQDMLSLKIFTILAKNHLKIAKMGNLADIWLKKPPYSLKKCFYVQLLVSIIESNRNNVFQKEMTNKPLQN